jgi:hypothetical protein
MPKNKIMGDYILQKVIFDKMTKIDMTPHYIPWDLCHPKGSLIASMFFSCM